MVSAIGIVALAGLALRKASVVPAVPSSSLGQRLRVIGRVDNFLTTLVTFFVGVGSLGLYTYIPVVLDRVQVDTIAGIWVWGIGGAVGAFGIGRVLDKVNSSRKLTVIIIALLVTDFALLLLFPSSHVVAVVCLLLGGFWGGRQWRRSSIQCLVQTLMKGRLLLLLMHLRTTLARQSAPQWVDYCCPPPRESC